MLHASTCILSTTVVYSPHLPPLCLGCAPPAVVFIRNPEQLLAGSYDAYDAFANTFGKTGLEAALEGTASHAPLVLLGGISVNESAAALAGVRPQRQRGAAGGGGEEGEEDEEGAGDLRPKPSSEPRMGGGDRLTCCNICVAQQGGRCMRPL